MIDSSVIILKGLEGNELTHLSGFQLALASNLSGLKLIWWGVFTTAFLYMAIRYVILPLLRKMLGGL